MMNENETKAEWWQTFFYGPWQDVQLSGYPEEQGYFDDQQNLRFASRVAEALRAEGRFLIDIHVAESIFPKFRERDWQWVCQDPPLRILEERQWNLDSGRIESTWSFIGETTSSHRISMRIYTYRELCELLRAAGFSRFEAFETGTQQSFRLGSPRLSPIAQK